MILFTLGALCSSALANKVICSLIHQCLHMLFTHPGTLLTTQVTLNHVHIES